jgi:hypothetical protein
MKENGDPIGRSGKFFIAQRGSVGIDERTSTRLSRRRVV